ncbi:MAG: bifunctional methylenetetrahydrofolate dehydrogenase/methenyltetrahydrofolate cyclohydrolase, partial [Chromatiaceae bacterium]|nr:bifunctional methylenetetrahydrofolate dehydrogenase/methenyltetrahydrofolate cyclohydrolase [Chromatiaceae bacterium]
MSARILDGKAIAADIRAGIKQQVNALVAAGGRQPGLAVVLVGDNPASRVYVRNKSAACAEVGFHSEMHLLEADVPQADLLALIDTLNAREAIDGILV